MKKLLRRVVQHPLLPSLSLLALAALLSSCAGAGGRAKPPLRTVEHVDIPRYMGDWRVIANIPYFAENGCIDSIESYALRPDGSIANWFTFRKGSFDAPQKRLTAEAEVTNRKTNAEWKVTFFGAFTVKYLVLDLDPHYQWAVIGHPSRKYGWVIAREKTLSEASYQAILKRLAEQGYDPAAFKKVPQLPEQLGAPGFQ